MGAVAVPPESDPVAGPEVAAERARAETVEGTLAAAITTEQTRAETAEADLAASIATEAAARTDADDDLEALANTKADQVALDQEIADRIAAVAQEASDRIAAIAAEATTRAAADTAINTTLAAKADLVAGTVPTSQIPAIALVTVTPVANRAAMLALTAQPGDVAIVAADNDGKRHSYMLGAGADPTVYADWIEVDGPVAPVSSVNGQTGTIVLGKADVGLANVDNTSDAGKPVSTAQQTALNAKAAATRQIITGTGLTGGGDLSADRTLAPDFGTGAGKVTQGNDARLSDARTPTAHAASHATGGSDAITPGAIGAAQLVEAVTAIANSGSAVTVPDVTSATLHRYTLTANCTFTFPTAAAGKSFTLELVQDATGSRTATWPGTVKWPGGTAPTLTPTVTKRDFLTFVCSDGTNWIGFAAGLGYS
jgi:hypothetical protein